MSDKLDQLKEKLATVQDLRAISSVIGWDQEAMMPKGAAKARADQRGTINSLAHDYFTADEIGTLLDDLSSEAADLDPDSDDACLITVVKRQYDKATKLPGDFVKRRSQVQSESLEAWRKARAEDDWPSFEPHMERVIEIAREGAGYYAPFDDPYDPLLDAFEPGLTVEYVDGVFAGLKPPLIELVKVISEAEQIDDSVLHRSVPADVQMAFSKEVITKLGYRFENGRLDLSTHPFSSGSSMYDVRLTTRFDEMNAPSGLMSSIHEAGHGMHRQNCSESLYRTPLWQSSSQAVGESQSRLYENNLGRSKAFWRTMYPTLQAAYAPAFDDVAIEDFYRAINKVEPSLIRVEADEVTYGLHIILRYELEKDMLNGRVNAADLPAAWNARMEEYLGVVPSTDTEGVLQDIHWAMGLMGYFPDYLLGSIWAVQLWNQMAVDVSDLEARIEAGDFAPILDWNKEAVMQHGVKFTLPELSDRILGEPLDWQPYMTYLQDKFTNLYFL